MQVLQARPEWHKRFQSIEAAKGTSPVWFGFCALLKKKYSHELPNYLKYLTECGVENRPILAGNIVRQPMLFNAGLKLKSELFIGAETVHQAGFFIGLQVEPIKPELIEKLVEIILGYW